MKRVVIIGGSGGIGRALIDALLTQDADTQIVATYYQHPPAYEHENLSWRRLDVTQEEQISTFFKPLGQIDWLINCVGLLHTPDRGPEKSIKHFDPSFFLSNMKSNCQPTLSLAKYALSHFDQTHNCLFAVISAKVGSIEDNRLGGWYSYRCSKAALNMAIKCLSIEWQRSAKHLCVAALHPGTTDTALSKPFQRGVAPSKLFSTKQTAGYLMEVMLGLQPSKTGHFWSWDGKLIPW